MKKIVSLALTLLLVLTAVSAFAQTIRPSESARTFDVEITLPENATLDERDMGEIAAIEITLPETGAPLYHFLISPDEEYEGRSMGDLTEDERADLLSMMEEGMAAPAHQWETLENGKLMLILDEDVEQNDFAYAILLHDGYFVTMYACHDDFDKLSEDEVDAMLDMMRSIAFLPNGQ